MPSSEGLDGGVPFHPAGLPVEVRFDRLLAPSTLSRSTIGMRSGLLSVFGGVRYDMVRRSAVFTPNSPEVRPGLEYVLVTTSGVRGWDGAAQTAPLQMRFRAGPRQGLPAVTAVSLARDVAPLFAARCAQGACHGGEHPVMGLDLSSPAAIRNTTIGVRAREWMDGPVTRVDPRWGAMDRIDQIVADGQGRPEYSYLVYKLLGDGPMVGLRMPMEAPPLTDEEADLVVRWIAAGAPNN